MAEQLAPDPAPAFQPERRFISMLAWTQKHRRFLSEGVPFDLYGHRYLAGIYKDASRELVIMKSGQGGASEYCISRALWCCDVRLMNVLYLLPTIADISDFSQMRIGTALESSPYLASIVVPGREEKKRGGDRVQLKRIRDRWLVLRGAQVRAGQSGDGGPRSGASRLKSVPVDLVVYDEFDEMPAGVEALAVKRLGHSAYKEQVWVSTPTYPGVGIHDKWLLSDQRRWEVQCWRCNTWQPLTIDHVVIEQDDLGRPMAWNGQNEDRAFCACEKCGAELDRLADGRWVPQNPGAAITGYSFNKLATAQNDPLSVVMALQTTDESKRQEAFNQDLALPYRPRGGGLDASILDACQRDYAFSSATAVGETTVMGVDVGRVLNVVVRALDQGAGRHMRWAGEVMTFEEAADIAKRFRVSRIVMDALPETRKAREFQAMFPARVCWLAYYSDGGKAGEAVSWKDERGPEGWMGTVTVDRTRTLDETVHRFTAGENTLPGHIRSLPRYYEQLQAIVRVVQRQPSGIEIARYIETGPDHYCFVAGTAIETSDGPIPIEQVAVGASVLTRAGYRQVTASGLTNPDADVRRFIFSDGSSLVATPSHPVYVQGKGFVALGALTIGDRVSTCQSSATSKPSRTKALSSEDTPIASDGQIGYTLRLEVNTRSKASSDCTRRFGKTFTGLSRLIATFITWTTTRSTTIRPTFSVFQEASTGRTTARLRTLRLIPRSSLSDLTGYVRCQRIGIRQKLEKSFIGDWQPISSQPSRRRSFVFSAESHFLPSALSGIRTTAIAQMPATLPGAESWALITRPGTAKRAALHSSAIATAEQSTVRFVKSEAAGKAAVYNMTVDGMPEYYANGILVHNCHAENYATVASFEAKRSAGSWGRR